MAKAERWILFLDQIFDGDRTLVDRLHRFCGYLLTGSTQEQIFHFCHGLGANGKSVFIEVLKYVPGDHARAIAPETLADSTCQGSSATPDLAALICARLVMCNETEDNTAMAESLVKERDPTCDVQFRYGWRISAIRSCPAFQQAPVVAAT
jgi:putative DNA primase/helicase